MTRTALLLSLVVIAIAAEPPAKAEVAAMIGKAEAYILAQQQPDGGFTEGARFALGITQLAAIGLTMPPGLQAQDPRLAKALAFMEAFAQPDGGVYPPEGASAPTTPRWRC